MRGEHQLPEGLRYQPDFLTVADEGNLLDHVGGLEYAQIELRGQIARRTVRLFGYDYDFESRTAFPTEPLPRWLLPLRDRCAAIAGVEPAAFEHALVNRYPPGAAIGWHRDAPPFGPIVAGVSLAADSELRFQRTVGGVRYVFQQPIARRSAYVLGGLARSAWQHSIPPGDQLRYSVTFRTLNSLVTAKSPCRP